MIFNIMGNACSGKTILAKRLEDEFGLVRFSLEDARQKSKNEWDAWFELFTLLGSHRSLIIDSSGANSKLQAIVQAIDADHHSFPVVSIKLDVSVPEALARYEKRKGNKRFIPSPYDWEYENYIEMYPVFPLPEADLLLDTEKLNLEEQLRTVKTYLSENKIEIDNSQIDIAEPLYSPDLDYLRL